MKHACAGEELESDVVVPLRPLLDPAEPRLGDERSLVARQQRDHEHLVVLVDWLTHSPATDQGAILREICRVVFPHAFADEAVLWPAVRKHLPYGETLVQQMNEERREMNDLACRLQEDALVDADRSTALARLREVLLDAVRHEEEVLLPLLQSRIDEGRLRQLGAAWEIVRRTAPTRPHPLLVRNRVSNCLVLLPLTLLDRTRDRKEISRRPAHGDAATALRLVS